MKFCWCTITVSSLEKSIKFYEEIVQLSVNSRFKAGPGKEIAFLGNGETKIELVWEENYKVNTNDGISLGFEVDSVENMINFLMEKGYEVESGPFQPSPYIKLFFIRDPNGVSIQFVENIIQ